MSDSEMKNLYAACLNGSQLSTECLSLSKKRDIYKRVTGKGETLMEPESTTKGLRSIKRTLSGIAAVSGLVCVLCAVIRANAASQDLSDSLITLSGFGIILGSFVD
jgi:hypothetical protein